MTTSKSDFEDLATATLQAAWPGWIGEDGDPEIINIESISPLAVNLSGLLANMPKAALIAMGVKLLGIGYSAGQSAYTTVRFTVQDAAGYTIPVNSGLVIDGYGFVLTADGVVPPGSTTVDVLVASTDRTAAANGLTGALVDKLAMPGFVTGMSVLSATVGGVDPQTDDDYADQVSRDRRLNSRAVVTPLDFELEALDTQGITRAHADVPSANNVTVTVLGVNGAPATTLVKTQLAADYATKKLVNVVVTISDPTFNTIGVTYQVQGESGFDPVDLITRVNTALIAELSPLTHGVPEAGDPGNAVTTWINDPYIYLYRMIQVAGGVLGVHRVVSMTLNGTYQGKLSANLSTGAAITSLPMSTVAGSNLLNTIPIGVITLNDGAGHTQNWTTTAQVAPNASSIPVASQTPNFAYPSATTKISGPVVGDFQMSGSVPVPQPGVMAGTAI